MTGCNERLRRRPVVRRLLANRGDMLVVAGLGSTAWDVAAAGDHDLSFPLWGAMGGAAMVGLGLALAQPGRSVLVITGDGEMLMGLGALATIAVQAPLNLSVIVLDNEHYGETGMQLTHTAYGVDLSRIAEGAGIPRVSTVRTDAELAALCAAVRDHAGTLFATVKIDPETLPVVLPPSDGAFLKNRFRLALLGEKAVYG